MIPSDADDAPITAPTLWITNWSSRSLHGPGRKLTIMARPRHFEHGDGRVPAATPLVGWLDRVRSGRITLAQYRANVEFHLVTSALEPGRLVAIAEGDHVPVADGDTLLCACSRDEAAAGQCHRVWVAEALRAAGWDVVLDGVRLGGEG